MTIRCDECTDRAQDDCPHLGPEARATLERLTAELAKASRALRRAESKLHQRDRECKDLEAAIVGHQDRLGELENIQIAGARAADRELEARLAQIEQQHREIAALSTPCIQIHDGVLVLPLIGEFDELRAQVLRETVLAAIPRHAARTVILDLTGVAEIDRDTVGRLFAIAAAIRLLGAGLILVGMSPRLAMTIVRLDLHMPDFTILRDLREAVATVLRRG
jgi:rsbT co-antagonist protein RsbR